MKNRIVPALLVSLVAALALGACGDKNGAKPAAMAPATSAPAAVPAQAVAKPDPEKLAADEARARIEAPDVPLSALAELGRKMFYDKSLSGSGKLACASCHSPEHAYAPGNELAVQLGGLTMQRQGGRAVPSLAYHDHAPPFTVGPDLKVDDDDKGAVKAAAEVQNSVQEVAPRAAKATMAASAASQELVPQGGFDWDGRAINMTDQASGPLMDPNEMANKNAQDLTAKLKAAPYADDMKLLFGPGVFTSPNIALGEAYFALARYQIEERSFHPYNSKYDYYLARMAQLSEQEKRGLDLFNDPKKGNCASCHIDKPSRDGKLPPAFTDYQFEALAAPRNKDITANRDPKYFDQGICGPWRKDYEKQLAYCGMFKTPSLRNTALRHAFFHNGVFQTLQQVMDFYNFRDTNPEKVYPLDVDGKAQKYNDIPVQYHANVDVSDPPFNRHPGETPAMTAQDEADIIAFLKTLNDGYKPEE